MLETMSRTVESDLRDMVTGLGNTLNASGVRVFQAAFDLQWVLHLSQTVSWQRDSGFQVVADADMQAFSLREKGLNDLHEALMKGHAVQGKPEEVAAVDMPLFSPDAEQVMLLPIHLEGEWWGLVVLDDAETPIQDAQDIVRTFEAKLAAVKAHEKRSQAAHRTQTLEAVMNDPALDDEGRVEALLAFGAETFEQEVGIVSHIEDDVYTVRYFYPADSGLERGQTFERGITYCDVTMDLPAPLDIPHVHVTQYNAHPCYAAFQIESYIGAVTTVRGLRYGTVNFTSVTPRTQPLSNMDMAFLQDIARQVGKLLERGA